MSTIRLTKNVMLPICLIGFLMSAVMADDSVNVLSKQEREAGFNLLFNGKDLGGWKHSGN